MAPTKLSYIESIPAMATESLLSLREEMRKPKETFENDPDNAVSDAVNHQEIMTPAFYQKITKTILEHCKEQMDDFPAKRFTVRKLPSVRPTLMLGRNPVVVSGRVNISLCPTIAYKFMTFSNKGKSVKNAQTQLGTVEEEQLGGTLTADLKLDSRVAPGLLDSYGFPNANDAIVGEVHEEEPDPKMPGKRTTQTQSRSEAYLNELLWKMLN